MDAAEGYVSSLSSSKSNQMKMKDMSLEGKSNIESVAKTITMSIRFGGFNIAITGNCLSLEGRVGNGMSCRGEVTSLLPVEFLSKEELERRCDERVPLVSIDRITAKVLKGQYMNLGEIDTCIARKAGLLGDEGAGADGEGNERQLLTTPQEVSDKLANFRKPQTTMMTPLPTKHQMDDLVGGGDYGLVDITQIQRPNPPTESERDRMKIALSSALKTYHSYLSRYPILSQWLVDHGHACCDIDRLSLGLLRHIQEHIDAQLELVNMLGKAAASLARSYAHGVAMANDLSSFAMLEAKAIEMLNEGTIEMQLTPLELLYHLVPLGQLAVKIVYSHFVAVDSPLLNDLKLTTESFSLKSVGELDCVTSVNQLAKLKSRLKTDGVSFNADPVVKAIIDAVMETEGLKFVRYDGEDGTVDLDWVKFFQETVGLKRMGIQRSFTMTDLEPLLRKLSDFGNAQSIQATLLGEKAVGNSAQGTNVCTESLFHLEGISKTEKGTLRKQVVGRKPMSDELYVNVEEQITLNWTVLDQSNTRSGGDPWILSQHLLQSFGWLVVQPCIGPPLLIDRKNYGHELERTEAGFLVIHGYIRKRGVFVSGLLPSGAHLPTLTMLIDNASTVNVASRRWNDYLDVDSRPGPAVSVAGNTIVKSVASGTMSVILPKSRKKKWTPIEVGEMLFNSRGFDPATTPQLIGTVYGLSVAEETTVAAELR